MSADARQCVPRHSRCKWSKFGGYQHHWWYGIAPLKLWCIVYFKSQSLSYLTKACHFLHEKIFYLLLQSSLFWRVKRRNHDFPPMFWLLLLRLEGWIFWGFFADISMRGYLVVYDNVRERIGWVRRNCHNRPTRPTSQILSQLAHLFDWSTYFTLANKLALG